MGVIRFLFALTVLLSHEVDLFGLTLTGSIIAVQCFYIISGFYMGIILEEKYKLSDYKLFISNRFLGCLDNKSNFLIVDTWKLELIKIVKIS